LSLSPPVFEAAFQGLTLREAITQCTNPKFLFSFFSYFPHSPLFGVSHFLGFPTFWGFPLFPPWHPTCCPVHDSPLFSPLYTATHCNTLQHTATHCNTLQHTATHPTCCPVHDSPLFSPLVFCIRGPLNAARIPYLYRSFSAKVTYI